MPPGDLDQYRAHLTQAWPFAGETRLGPGLRPATFATTVDGTALLGVLNRERAERDVPVDLEELGLDPNAAYLAYDPETNAAFTASTGSLARLPSESFQLHVLRSAPGVLWTSSSFHISDERGCLQVTVGGPERVPGYIHPFVPRPSAVYLDGQALAAGAGTPGYAYDARVGLLSVPYPHGPRASCASSASSEPAPPSAGAARPRFPRGRGHLGGLARPEVALAPGAHVHSGSSTKLE